MKFIKLEILNLASLDRQGGEIINFNEGALSESTIFSIVGPTGSGKSTILDAICLALYNRAPRYPRKRGDKNHSIEIFGEPDDGEKNRIAPTDSRNILTRGKKEGYSKLTFLANNGTLYRAEWYVRFLRINYDNVKTSLYKITDKVEEEVEWDTLPQLIGLDYEQFLRTVLIAQGSFASFISAKEDERYALLEKLVGCEGLYTSIAEKIKSRCAEAKKSFEDIKVKNDAYESETIKSDDELEELRQRIETLEDDQRKVKDQLSLVQKAIAWYATNETYLDNISRYSHTYQLAEQALAEAKYMVDRLKLHDLTLPAVRLYGEMIVAKNNVDTKQQELLAIEHNINGISSGIMNAEVELEALSKEEQNTLAIYTEQRPHINNARNIKTEISVIEKSLKEKESERKKCQRASNDAVDNVARNTEAINEATDKLSQVKERLERLNEEIKTRKEELATAVEVATTPFITAREQLKQQDVKKLQENKSVAEHKYNDINDAIRIVDDMAKSREIIDSNRREIDLKVSRNSILSEELKTLAINDLMAEVDNLRTIHTLITSENWQEHRRYLANGKPCPLCGATQHPYSDDKALAPEVSELQQIIKRKEEQIQKMNARKEEILKERSANSGTITAKKQENEVRKAELTNLAAAWGAIQSRYSEWTDDRSTLESLKTIIRAGVIEASQKLSEYNSLASEVEKLRANKESAEKQQKEYNALADSKLRNAEMEKAEADSKLQMEKGQTKNLIAQQAEKAKAFEDANAAFEEIAKAYESKKDALKAEVGDKDLDEYERELTKAKNDAMAAVVRKQNDISGLRETLNGFNGQSLVIKDFIEAEKERCKENSDSIDAWLRNYNANNAEPLTIDDIALYYNAKDDWEAMRLEQKSMETAITETRTLLHNAQSVHSNHQISKPEMSKEDLLAKETELKQWSVQELVEAKARMERHNQAVAKMGALFEQMQEAELLKSEWEEISDSIGGDGKMLRKIAQCYTLRFLIEHANAEIRKFNSRYELMQVKNSLGIRVIDHDRADDIRDTTSLSGGETFIVSLGLALGLSALSSRNISFGNLFIDEGFGTLDPDTLATVIDSLAMLQSSQGKKVGVISHTDTMSERITTQIRIIKNGNSGSSHIEIYP